MCYSGFMKVKDVVLNIFYLIAYVFFYFLFVIVPLHVLSWYMGVTLGPRYFGYYPYPIKVYPNISGNFEPHVFMPGIIGSVLHFAVTSFVFLKLAITKKGNSRHEIFSLSIIIPVISMLISWLLFIIVGIVAGIFFNYR